MRGFLNRLGRSLALPGFVFVYLVCCFCMGGKRVVAATPLSFAWTPGVQTDSDETNIGYFLYWGPNIGNWSGNVDAGTNLTATVPVKLKPGWYFFTTVAYDDHGNASDPSPFLEYRVPYIAPPIPVGVRVAEVSWLGILTQTTNFGVSWTTNQWVTNSVTIPATNVAQYFRLLVPMSGASVRVYTTLP